MSKITVVIPCFNEFDRLDKEQFSAWVRDVEVGLVFVNDGSTDRTQEVLEKMSEDNENRIEVLSLDKNRGKAEAVREGLRHAFANGADLSGFLDADLATSLAEAERIIEKLMSGTKKIAMGARVSMIDHEIERTAVRHYLGRAFATFASVGLSASFYDTQCGAKFFKATPRLLAALEAPFKTKWVFDVELLWRLMYAPLPGTAYAPRDFMEVPLQAWIDQKGSKLSAGQTASIAVDCMKLLALFAKKNKN